MILLAAALISAPSAPPIVRVPIATGSPGLQMVSFEPGDASCGDRAERPVHVEQPLPSPPLGGGGGGPLVLRFRIDASGRPLGITWDNGDPGRRRMEARDLQPAFAAWRFSPGAERTGCRITFTARTSAPEEADRESLFRYAALARPNMPGFNNRLARAGFEIARGEASNCDRSPQPRRLVYPEFDRIEQAPGRLSFVMINYDIDVAGKPVDVQIVGSSGNAELDRRAVEALRKSRFAAEARRGCAHFFFRNPAGPLEAPPGPPLSDLQPASATCPKDGEIPWKQMPQLVFPEPFRRRSIEGWAIVRYDVAPWGEVGKITVLAAEPASDFGDQARTLMSRATKLESRSGHSGCVMRVVFKMGNGVEEEPRRD